MQNDVKSGQPRARWNIQLSWESHGRDHASGGHHMVEEWKQAAG